MIGWERIQGGKANLRRWVLSFERNVETDINEIRVSGGREFQSLGATTEKALLPRDVQTYGIDRTDESDRQRKRRKRKTFVKIGRLLNLKRFICKIVIDALFDWKPMYFFEYWCNVFKF